MANSIASDLQVQAILENALLAFKRTLAPVNAFSTVYRGVPLQGNDTVTVPYYPLQGTASNDFNGSYSADAGTVQSRNVVINKRKYQALNVTGYELARQPHLSVEKLMDRQAEALAHDVVMDILSVVTAANYGSAVSTGAPTAFDFTDIADIVTSINNSYWPVANRSLVLSSTYHGALLKDPSIANWNAMGQAGADVKLKGALTHIAGLDVFVTPNIPANSENLVGFATLPDAALVAFAPIAPADDRITRYVTATDDNGLTLEYREYPIPGSDTVQMVIEANYGYGKGEGAALKRIVSA
jgi:hypothetical protein